MDALLMCGGKGTRLDTPGEKPLYPLGERPMIDHVAAALDASHIQTWYGVTSPHTPKTRTHLNDAEVPLIETPGDGYTPDLTHALDDSRVNQPILTVNADLPLLTGGLLDHAIADHNTGALTVQVPAALKRLLGVSVDPGLTAENQPGVPVGLNIVDDDEAATTISYDARLAINVNTQTDAEAAEALL